MKLKERLENNYILNKEVQEYLESIFTALLIFRAETCRSEELKIITQKTYLIKPATISTKSLRISAGLKTQIKTDDSNLLRCFLKNLSRLVIAIIVLSTGT